LALDLASFNTGSKIDAKMATIAIATSSSISVNLIENLLSPSLSSLGEHRSFRRRLRDVARKDGGLCHQQSD